MSHGLRFLPRARGFTIIEAVAVMVVTGIIGAIVAVFIQVPVRGYINTVARTEASDLADNAMRRLARDLRLALPNSIRVDASGTHIEFIETKLGLRYLAEDDINTPGGTALDWNNAAATTFTVVGGVPTGRHAPVAGEDSIVVYNLGEGQEPGNAYNCSGLCNRTLIQSFDAGASTMTMAANPYAAQAAGGVALRSPGSRFHVVTTPVTYACNAATGRLTRHWNYGFLQNQALPPSGGSSAILADNLQSCSFSYANMATQRSGLVGVTITFRVRDETAAPLTLLHQIHVSNSP